MQKLMSHDFYCNFSSFISKKITGVTMDIVRWKGLARHLGNEGIL
tara:strand:+ start:437 stop:571 length:135 start_codon:yes stop_codon:yes gene_type:complete